MLLKIIPAFKINEIRGVAVSGGPDSMALLDFLTRHPKNQITAYFFHHGTPASDAGEKIVSEYCAERHIQKIIGHLTGEKPSGLSLEEWWRNARLDFFRQCPGLIATGHNLNDVAETWIMGSIHGTPKIIPFQNQNIIRPLLLTPKNNLISWCKNNKIPFIEDISNTDVRFDRNRIRKNIIPEILHINPGFLKVMAKKVKAEIENPRSS